MLQILRHVKSGEDYLVDLIGGIAYSSCGPLHYKEVAEFLLMGLPGTEDDPELTDEINNSDEYLPLSENAISNIIYENS